jgi:hypothetical protein
MGARSVSEESWEPDALARNNQPADKSGPVGRRPLREGPRPQQPRSPPDLSRPFRQQRVG